MLTAHPLVCTLCLHSSSPAAAPPLSPAGTSTNGQSGQPGCTYVKPGYYYNSTSQTAEQCPVDTFAATDRPKGAAISCTACPAGSSTFGATGQSACTPTAGTVPPGQYWDNATQTALPCPANT